MLKISYSTLEQAKLCLARGVFSAAGVARGESTSASLMAGTQAHKELATAKNFEELGPLARIAAQAHPAWQNGLREEKITFEVQGGVQFTALLDWQDAGKVVDYKFSGSRGFNKLPKNAKELKKDYQLLTYAWLTGATSVAHVQVNTDSQTVRVLESEVTSEELENHASQLAEDIQTLVQEAKKEQPARCGQPGMGPGCNAWNRPCEYLSHCRETSEESEFTGWEVPDAE